MNQSIIIVLFNTGDACPTIAMDGVSQDKKPVSFGFSKKKQKLTVIEQGAIGEKHVKEKEETDYVLELQGKEVKR